MPEKQTNVEPWIMTYSGQHINYLEPDKNSYDIRDIAHALSNICRYTGHCQRFYSVAEHSVRVSLTLPYKLTLQGLLHDAVEAYLGDVNTPLKQLLPEYKKLEKSMSASIMKYFGLPTEIAKEVHEADHEVFCREWQALMPDKSLYVPKERREIACFSPQEAENIFLKLFNSLVG